jgi:DNA-directed RNA polymerase beta subunit
VPWVRRCSTARWNRHLGHAAKAGLDTSGRSALFDGRTGEAFDRRSRWATCTC